MTRNLSVESDMSAMEDLEGGNLSRRKRCQRRISVLLHTHVILIIVCLLAALDAVCVIGQLICDILIMREKLDHYETIDDQLSVVLFDHIPKLNETIHPKWNLEAILAVLTGTGHHAVDGPVPTPPANITSLYVSDTGVLSNSTMDAVMEHALHRHRRAASPSDVPGHEVEHGMLYHLTHGFHLASLVILSVLLIETLFKVFAMGKKLKHHKLEVFDAVVVAISWSLDVAFWEGLWAHPGTTAATILIYMLPWRVVRIVNSFVLVIQEKDLVQLKIVKQRLRQSLKKSKESADKTHIMRHEVKTLAGLCRKMGASEADISACSPSGHTRRRSSVHSVLERAASLTFISTLSSMGSLPSLFDMGDISSEDEEDNHSTSSNPKHNPLDRKKSAMSSTTLDSNSVVLSLGTDHGGHETPASDNTSTASKDSRIQGYKEGDATKDTPCKIPIVWTSSSESMTVPPNSENTVPPSYHIAISQMDSNTRL